MEWADLIAGAVSVGSGGLFGLLGSAVGVVAKYFQEKQRQTWEREKWSHETELLRLNMEARAQETEQELAIVSQEGSWGGLSESIRAEKSVKNVHTWVNDITGTVPAVPYGPAVGSGGAGVLPGDQGVPGGLDRQDRYVGAYPVHGLFGVLLRQLGHHVVVWGPGFDSGGVEESVRD